MEKCHCNHRLHGNSPALLPYALLDAIAKDETLLDPSEMFKVNMSQGEIDTEDAAYWNVEIASEAIDETPPQSHPLILADMALGGVRVDETLPQHIPAEKRTASQDTGRLVRYVGTYLDSVHLVHDEVKRMELQAELLSTLMDGVQDNENLQTVVGMRDPDFTKYPVHAEKLTGYVRTWLKQHRFVFAGCEDEVAAKIVDLAQQALGLKPIQLDVFQAMQDAQDAALNLELSVALQSESRQEDQRKRRKKRDLLAVPDATSEAVKPKRPLVSKRPKDETEPVQLAMF